MSSNIKFGFAAKSRRDNNVTIEDTTINTLKINLSPAAEHRTEIHKRMRAYQPRVTLAGIRVLDQLEVIGDRKHLTVTERHGQ